MVIVRRQHLRVNDIAGKGNNGGSFGGGSIPGVARPAFVFLGTVSGSLPVLIGAPHGGRQYPSALCDNMRGGDQTRLRLEDRHIDTLARELAAVTGASCLLAEAPRAMIDLNRASDDIDWSMISGKPSATHPPHSLANRRARSGLGLVPRRLSGLGEVWKRPLPHADLEQRIASIHRPYHRKLSQELIRLRDEWGAVLLLDVHSMPPLRKRYPGEEPADIVIGDRFGASCEAELSAYALSYLTEQGRRAAHNRPYSGGFILDSHTAPGQGLHGIQIEICRSLYLDAQFDQPTARMGAIVKLLAGLVRGLAQRVAELGSSQAPALAAE